MERPIIEVKKVKKKYILGNIGTGTLTNDLRSWWAAFRNKEDPNAPLLEENRRVGDEFMALNGVSFAINQGEKVGIIGGNGAGKSTLLKILSRITSPTSGEVILRGNVTSMLEVGTGFNPEMTGRENIYLNGAIIGMTKAEIDGKIEEIIEFSEVREFIDTPVKRYSSGMFVKLAFSVSAHLDSEVLIMDEVLAVGDAAFQKKCLDKMQSTAFEQNRTILFVSHNMQSIKKLCDRCIVLKDGKVTFDGDVDEGVDRYLSTNVYQSNREIVEFEIEDNINKETKALFKSARIINYDKGVISSSDYLELLFNLRVFEDISNCTLRVCIKSPSNDVIGMMCCDTGFIKESMSFDLKARVDVRNLTNGKYCLDFYLGVFEKTKIHSFDHKGSTLNFEICDRLTYNDVVWLPSHWGYLQLN